MKICMLILAGSALMLAGCSAEGDDKSSEGGSAPPPSTALHDSSSALPGGGTVEMVALEGQSVEVGCGACIYNMPGVEACKTAVMINGVPVLVRGEAEDAHAHGLCSDAKTAVVSGKVEGDHFVATSVEVN